jgi:CubicO group peptidase (beta-lactamase class C family)
MQSTLFLRRSSKTYPAHHVDFLASHIFEPLGMRNSVFGVPPGSQMKGYVRAYPDGNGRAGAPDALGDEVGVGGAGRIYRTVDDMLTRSLAQGTGKLLSRPAFGDVYRSRVRFGIWHPVCSQIWPGIDLAHRQ